MNLLERWTERIGFWFEKVALVALTAMLVLVAADILGSKIFSRPVSGAMDLASLFGLLLIGFSMAMSYQMGRHIKVDFVTAMLPIRARRILRAVSAGLCWIFFAVVIWRMFLYSMDLYVYGEKSLTVKIPLYPFGFALSLAFIPLLIVIPIQLVNIFKHSGE